MQFDRTPFIARAADLGPDQIRGAAHVLEQAHLKATDRGIAGTDPQDYFAFVWQGLSTLRDLAGADDPRLFEVLDELNADALRWTLAQAATELAYMGWEYGVDGDDEQ